MADDLGMGPGVTPGARDVGAKMPEEVGHGRSPIYDRARAAGATIEQALREEARNVFGVDAKQDRHGNWIEQGIGSKGNESIGHYQAIRKYEGGISYQKRCEKFGPGTRTTPANLVYPSRQRPVLDQRKDQTK